MKLKKIISLANKTSELRFLAMVRSLRATGCTLPVWVIPYDENRFELPENCTWWEIDEIMDLARTYNLQSMKKKFQCLLTDNYQFVDADVIFLTNPEHTLANLDGFITSCCHWNNPYYTYSDTTREYFKEKSTTWQKSVFNAGQYACDSIIYSFDELKSIIENPLYADSIIALENHDQIALNLLIFLSGVKITNTTLPPYNMESTWAGDYLDNNFERYWINESTKPYLMHWAGCRMDIGRPIDQLFLNFLTGEEKLEWAKKLIPEKDKRSRLRIMLSRLKRTILNK